MFKNNSLYFLKNILIVIVISSTLLFAIESYSVQASCSPVMDSSVDEIKDLLGAAAEDQLIGEELDGIGLSSPTINSLISILRNWYDKSISLRLNEAKTNESELYCAVKEFSSWYYYIQSLGFEEYFETEIFASLYNKISPGIKNAIKKSYHKCLQHDLSGVNMILDYYALGAKLGLEDQLYSWEDIRKMVKKAAVFELEFKSISKFEGEVEFEVFSDRIKLEIDDEQRDLLGEFVWSGKGKLNYTKIEDLYPRDELYLSLGQNSHLEIPAAWIYLPRADLRCDKCKNEDDNLNQNIKGPADNTLYLMPGEATEKYTAYIDGEVLEVLTSGWLIIYAVCYQDILYQSEGFNGFCLQDWEINNGNKLYAVKETEKTKDEIYATNSLKLYHVPSKYDFK